MLGVHHLAHAGGQSLPNLSLSESSPSAPTSPAAPPLHGAGSLLSVPTGKGLSPQHRGVSYPPPSPRALRRSYAVPQSRNPPLLKSRHVLGARSANDADGSVDVPLIAGTYDILLGWKLRKYLECLKCSFYYYFSKLHEPKIIFLEL